MGGILKRTSRYGVSTQLLRVQPFVSVLILYLSSSMAIVYVGVTQFSLTDSATNDSRFYRSMTDGPLMDGVDKPYRYRVVVPLVARLFTRLGNLASSLGYAVDPDSGIKVAYGLIDLLALAAAATVLYLLARHFSLDPVLSTVGGLLFFMTYPVVRFGGAVLVDSASLAFMAAACLAALKERWVLLAVIAAAGIFTRETVLFAAIIAILAGTSMAKIVISFAPAVAGYLAVRLVLSPTSAGYTYSANRALSAVERVLTPKGLAQTGVELVLTFGFLWVLAVVGWRVNRTTRILPKQMLWSLPIAFVIPFLIDSNQARVWFLTFPVIILFALVGLSRILQVGSRTLPV